MVRSLRRGVRLRRGRATQQAFGAEVFVEVGPVKAIASARNLPVLALGGRGVEQARIPGERHSDNSAVAQGYAQRVGSESHVQYSLICCRRRKTHSNPPKTVPRVRPRLIVYRGVRARENQSSPRAAPAPARISPTTHRDRRDVRRFV